MQTGLDKGRVKTEENDDVEIFTGFIREGYLIKEEKKV